MCTHRRKESCCFQALVAAEDKTGSLQSVTETGTVLGSHLHSGTQTIPDAAVPHWLSFLMYDTAEFH